MEVRTRPREKRTSFAFQEQDAAGWRAVLWAGAAGAVPGFLAFTMAMSRPGLTRTSTWVVNPVFFGSLALALVGLLGLARSPQRRPLERARTPA